VARVSFPALAVISLSLRELEERLRHVALKWAESDGCGDISRS